MHRTNIELSVQLSLQNGGLLVDVNVSEHSTVISFSDYHEGAAPALIVNHTPWDSLRFKQRYVKEAIHCWLFNQGVSFVKKVVLFYCTLKNRKNPFLYHIHLMKYFVYFNQSS